MPSAVTRFAYDRPELSLSVNPVPWASVQAWIADAPFAIVPGTPRVSTPRRLPSVSATKLSDGRSIFVRSSCNGRERTDAIVWSPPGGLPLPGLPRTRTPSASSLVVSVFAASRSGSAPALWSNTSAVGRFT